MQEAWKPFLWKLPMNYKYLFGPILSRRLGRSLGINLFSDKICSLDCIYCESGPTSVHTSERSEFVPIEAILGELDHYLSSSPALDFITFAGSGEPTLYSKLGKVVSHIKENYPDYKLALLTNTTLIDEKEIWDEIKAVDLIVPSLDAADEDSFKKINRPVKELKLDSILNGLYNFSQIYQGEIWLEIFIIDGVNTGSEALSKIKNWVERINPAKIQINSLDRPPAYSFAKKPSLPTLRSIRNYFGDKAELVIREERFDSSISQNDNSDAEELILTNIRIRPMTFEDLRSLTGLGEPVLKSLLTDLKEKGCIEDKIIGEHLFYTV